MDIKIKYNETGETDCLRKMYVPTFSYKKKEIGSSSDKSGNKFYIIKDLLGANKLSTCIFRINYQETNLPGIWSQWKRNTLNIRYDLSIKPRTALNSVFPNCGWQVHCEINILLFTKIKRRQQWYVYRSDFSIPA